MEHSFDQSPNAGQSSALEPINVQAFLDLSPVAAFVLDRDLRFSRANSRGYELLGREPEHFLGRVTDEICRSPELMDRLREDNDVSLESFEIRRGDGTVIYCDINGRTLSDGSWLLLGTDVTERRQAERSLLASEKQRWKVQRTEALEKLAGGIAHDFNNFLAVILLQTDMIELQLAEGDQLANRVAEIKAVANDAAGIVRQLLAFGRRQSMNPSPAVLNKLIDAASRDFRALVGNRIDLELDLDEDLGVCFVDQNQIGQALMYLVVNARDAMPNGGRLTIRTINIDKGGPLIHKTQASGSYIQVEVADTGIGMDSRTADHVFEPFFSTKGTDKSAGLSLATVYGIVKQSGGYIWVSSTAGSGSNFKIQFPRVDEPKPQSRAESSGAGEQLSTILLIDDEPLVRRVAAEALRKSGYRVLEAANGNDGIDIARTFPDPIHLILVDYSMPAMNGGEAAKRIRGHRPEARIVYISGDPGSIGDDRSDTNFLGKTILTHRTYEKGRRMLVRTTSVSGADLYDA